MDEFVKKIRDMKLIYSYGDPGIRLDEHPSIQTLRALEDRLEAEELIRQLEITDRLIYQRRAHQTGPLSADCLCWFCVLRREEQDEDEDADEDADEDGVDQDAGLEDDEMEDDCLGDDGIEDDGMEGDWLQEEKDVIDDEDDEENQA
ncbi:hypothetical protein NMY22_g10436 [Coprinellus aureogranulatus]|nr:hypothetical protein NMY22_g10436 [Coprinellus aureogranulatus]